MTDVVLARVDERLVHGQIITSWSKHLEVRKIFIVDDLVVSDPFMYEVLNLSAPTGLNFEILSVEDATNKLIEGNDRNVMLLFKSVASARKLITCGYDLKSLNLGNVSSASSRKQLTRNVSLSEDEIVLVKEIVASGTKVYLQMLYTDSKIDVLTLI